ncbi:hypothetical protein [Alteromonas sp. ASW11-130]|uniref:hypothetical protein n=1 Tax=Alteromonas sp. ASW11-130 TaxID=3015775 RepID=UPI0022424704|nr:hypothetical protein [Alteromonas sp. ASW11-130]MCW8091724.1 hypothetical protein [Alteromonas sp. ASW11-130]
MMIDPMYLFGGLILIGWPLFYIVTFYMICKHHQLSPAVKVMGYVLWLLPPIGLLYLLGVGLFTKQKQVTVSES